MQESAEYCNQPRPRTTLNFQVGPLISSKVEATADPFLVRVQLYIDLGEQLLLCCP